MEEVKIARQTFGEEQRAGAVEGTNPDRPHAIEGSVPIALYEEMHGTPYSAVYFGVGGILNDAPEMRKGLREIDAAYRKKVQCNEIKDGPDSFKAFVKEGIKATDSEYVPDGVKIARVAEFVRFMSRIKDMDARKYA